MYVCMVTACVRRVVTFSLVNLVLSMCNCVLFQSSFLVAMGDISLRKTSVEEKRAKVQKESKFLSDYMRKAIARLTYLKR